MIYQLKRRGKLIGEVVPIDAPPIHAGTILFHEFVVRCPLFDGEALAVSYSTAAGVAITHSQMLFPRQTDEGMEYYASLPNKVVTAGNKKASVFILDLYAPAANGNGTQYRVITSADIPFTVYPSGANTDFEPVEESLSIRIQQRVNALSQSPDCTEAANVGIPEVTIKEDGRFKFKNLKGEPGKDGKDGENAVVVWGHNAPSPLSTLYWRKI